MIWYIAEDIFYYSNLNEIKAQLCNDGAKITEIIVLPNENDIKANISRKNIAFLAPYAPPQNIKQLFTIKNLPNKFGILTTQAKEANIPESKALEEKLGLSVIKSPFTLKDIGGATALKTYTAQLVEAEKQGYKAKGVFLVGIPGTGKTFFPKCFAGELNRMLIALNLSQIMESEAPIERLNAIFEYLHNRAIDYPDEKFVILIDEIEKMIGNATPREKQMLGRLLTVLNDINTPACEYNFNAIFFATANDLGSILTNNPEFLRRGRWDELFFINLPTHEYAKEMFKIYIKKYKLDFVLDIMNKDDNDKQITNDENQVEIKNRALENIFAIIEKEYQQENSIRERFPYTPAEIENFCKRLDFVKKAVGDNFSKDDITECVKMIIPLTTSAKDGLNKMVAQRKLFIEI